MLNIGKLRTLFLLNILSIGNCMCQSLPPKTDTGGKTGTSTDLKVNTHLTSKNLVKDIAWHPAFKEFGNLLLTRDDNAAYYNLPISNIAALMPYHNAVNPKVVLGAVNHLIDEVGNGKSIFYQFYNAKQLKEDPQKENTGLFYFRGDPGAPFAIVCPGGGFSYVGSLHEGLPLAQQISDKKLNAFVIRYRIGSEQLATEDLANAVRFVLENASALQVDTKNYSLWGGSAGARMVGNIAQHGLSRFTSGDYPKPVTAVIAYTGQSTYSNCFPSTFITNSADDGIANISVVENRVKNLKSAGVTVSYHRYNNAGHGFGLGTGTDAEGWLHKAVAFWKSQSVEK